MKTIMLAVVLAAAITPALALDEVPRSNVQPFDTIDQLWPMLRCADNPEAAARAFAERFGSFPVTFEGDANGRHFVTTVNGLDWSLYDRAIGRPMTYVDITVWAPFAATRAPFADSPGRQRIAVENRRCDAGGLRS